MNIGSPVVAHGKATELGQPGQGSLDLPAVTPEPFTAVDTAPGDPRNDGAGAALTAATTVIIALVGVELVRSATRTATSPPTGGTASRVGAIIQLSCRLAPLIVRPSGVPSPSTNRCRFVPALPRSVGLGPVSSPPLSYAWRRCRARPGSSRAGRHCAAAPAGPDVALARPRPHATPPAAASTSCRCSPSLQARPATGCRCAARTGCPPARPDPARAACRPSASAARPVAAAQTPPRDRCEREAMPWPLNAQDRVSSSVLNRRRRLSPARPRRRRRCCPPRGVPGGCGSPRRLSPRSGRPRRRICFCKIP